jgi:hypothetical protein
MANKQRIAVSARVYVTQSYVVSAFRRTRGQTRSG